MFGLELIPFGLDALIYAFKNISFYVIFWQLKPYIVVAILILLSFWGFKMLNQVVTFFKNLLSASWGRYLLVALGCLLLGIGVSKCSNLPIVGKSETPKVVSVRFVEERLRSKDGALLWRGQTYYKKSLINKYLERKGLVSRFQTVEHCLKIEDCYAK